MGKKKKSQKGQQNVREPNELVKAPHSFVLYRGKVGKNVAELMQNFRKVMEPFTASHLKVKASNCIKDFVSVSGVLNVTHLVLFTKSPIAVYMRIARLPQGPTLTFRIHNYSLAADVLSALKKPVSYAHQFEHQPLLVLNNFSGEGQHMKLMATMLQNMFPSINVNRVQLRRIKRCVLFNYNAEEKTLDFRHYVIKIVPTGISKAVKKLLQNKVYDLSNYQDISEFLINGQLSESEAELDGDHNEVVLPQNIGIRGKMASQKSAIRLVELGPRMTLQLIKIEEGLMNGEVIFHEIIQKTEEEKQLLRAAVLKKQKLKAKRKKQQEENVQLKQQQKEKLNRRSSKEPNKGFNEGDGDSSNNSEDDDSFKTPRHPKKSLKRKRPAEKDRKPFKKFKKTPLLSHNKPRGILKRPTKFSKKVKRR